MEIPCEVGYHNSLDSVGTNIASLPGLSLKASILCVNNTCMQSFIHLFIQCKEIENLGNENNRNDVEPFD